jgi:hypothetical protein
VLLLGLGVAGCSSSSSKAHPDLSVSGDMATPTSTDDLALAAKQDLAVAGDLAVALAARHQSQELVSASGQLSSASYRLDFQVGHPAPQGSSSGTTFTVEGNAAIKP